jgi:dTDP-4-amino-4,6-dideoxygalactose transaminase
MNKEPIPFARPFIGREEEEAVLNVLRSGWLTTGKEALAFEKEFAAFLNIKHALAVNSATSGLHLALEACGVTSGDLVLVPSYTFTSTAEVVRYLGAIPVFVDTVPGAFLMDPKALEAVLYRLSRGRGAYPKGGPRGKAKAVIPVHVGGLPCDMRAILTVARTYSLKVIEDAAHAFPSRMDTGSFAGTSGDAGVFSFYATKTITTGEGGMVVTANDETAARISIMRCHGIDRGIWNRYTDTKASWYYEVVEAGYKYNLPDLLAAIGRVQLKRAWKLLEMRRAVAAFYDKAFGDDEHFLIPPTGPGDARHLYLLRLRPGGLSVSRDEFMQKLQENGLGVSVHFIPLHTMPYYKNLYQFSDEDFPESLQSYKNVISLPIWPGMTGTMVERTVTMVKELGAAYTI